MIQANLDKLRKEIVKAETRYWRARDRMYELDTIRRDLQQKLFIEISSKYI